MARRFIDLSIYLETEVISDPPGMRPEITYIDHETGLREWWLASRTHRRGVPDAEGWAVKPSNSARITAHTRRALSLCIHNEWRERAITIDEFLLNGALTTALSSTSETNPTATWLRPTMSKLSLRIEYTLKPLDIVVVNTAGKRYGQDDYVSYGCGMGHDATMYLLERGVRVTGIDGWSWMLPSIHARAI